MYEHSWSALLLCLEYLFFSFLHIKLTSFLFLFFFDLQQLFKVDGTLRPLRMNTRISKNIVTDYDNEGA